jgi:hypothetical protein
MLSAARASRRTGLPLRQVRTDAWSKCGTKKDAAGRLFGDRLGRQGSAFEYFAGMPRDMAAGRAGYPARSSRRQVSARNCS